MDHAEVREQLELAAVEPGGLERLMAGDTTAAAAMAGHLAGCPECTAELERLRRSAALVRAAIRDTPPPDLRERTLALVRAVGRARAPNVEVPVAAPAADAPTVGAPAADAPAVAARSGGPSRFRWMAAIAAAVVLSVAATAAVLTAQNRDAVAERDALLARQGETVDALATVASWSVRVGGEPDARTVRLTSPGGGDASATIVFSPATRQLVVVAHRLDEPSAGAELRCWVEVDGERRPVGRMFFGGGLAYWVGDVDALADLDAGARFGISPWDASGGSGGGANPVLEGAL